MAATVRVGPKYQVVIPQAIRRKLGLAPRDEVLVEEMGGIIVILPRPKSYTDFITGLGKEIWKGIDPKAYVARERADWD